MLTSVYYDPKYNRIEYIYYSQEESKIVNEREGFPLWTVVENFMETYIAENWIFLGYL